MEPILRPSNVLNSQPSMSKAPAEVEHIPKVPFVLLTKVPRVDLPHPEYFEHKLQEYEASAIPLRGCNPQLAWNAPLGCLASVASSSRIVPTRPESIPPSTTTIPWPPVASTSKLSEERVLKRTYQRSRPERFCPLNFDHSLSDFCTVTPVVSTGSLYEPGAEVVMTSQDTGIPGMDVDPRSNDVGTDYSSTLYVSSASPDTIPHEVIEPSITVQHVFPPASSMSVLIKKPRRLEIAPKESPTMHPQNPK
ncbi:hypothetical protein CPB84DRAFT_1849578 [Gymnopilus junonius]|uniref:Uncharacterized protein n=1 Tax=Gymnopilus junonius TaxID=109634 RepID=A0A9P5NJC1_GYMJU|nr:hypothetical protein CPB84DRAFT_1849578 [Gymnopilus junonius]